MEKLAVSSIDVIWLINRLRVNGGQSNQTKKLNRQK
jgi:hypothetical protein